jgi:hypothetical protein
MRIVSFLSLLLAAVSSGCSTESVPTAPSATPAATFESQLYPQGVATQTFQVSSPGTVKVTLTSIRPDPATIVALGVGIPRANGGGCSASRSIETASGLSPQLTMTAEAGTYCVRVWDVGRLTGEIFFTVTIERP